MKAQTSSLPQVFLVAIALATALPHAAQGQASRVWNGNSLVDSNWTTSANWNALPVAGDNLTFSGSLRTNNNNNFAADTSFNNLTFSTGTSFTLGGNRITLAGGTITGNNSTSSVNLAIRLNTATTTINNSAGGILTIDGSIGETGGARGLSKTGAGELVLNASNTYTGNTSLSGGGRLVLGDAQAIGNGTGGLIFGTTAGNALVNSTGAALSLSHAITMNGATNINFEGSHNITLTGNIVRADANTRQIGVASGQIVTLAGDFTAAGALGTTNKNNPGVLVLSGNNSLNNLTVNAGALVANSATALGSGNIVQLTASSGAVLGIGSIGGEMTRSTADLRLGDGTGLASFVNGGTSIYNSSTGTLTFASTSNFVSTNLILGHALATGTIEVKNNLGLNTTVTNRTFTVIRGSNLSVSRDAVLSGVVSGAGNFVKEGNGILSLTNVNTYTGSTLVNAGTLLVNGSLAAASAVTVASGSTLGGSGTINGSVTIQNGGTLAPGNSPGILNSGSLSLDGTLAMELNGATVGTQYDQVNVTGTVNLLSGSSLSLTLGYTPVVGTNFFLIRNDGSDAITGTLNGWANGSTFALGGQSWTISYFGDFSANTLIGGNDLVIQAIPEPATWWLAAVGLAFVWMRRRHRGVME